MSVVPISEPAHAASAGYRLMPNFEAFPAMTPGGMQSMQNPMMPPNMNMPGPPLPGVPSPMHPPVPVPQGTAPLTLPPSAPSAGKEGIMDKIKKNKVPVIIGVIALIVILYLMRKKIFGRKRR